MAIIQYRYVLALPLFSFAERLGRRIQNTSHFVSLLAPYERLLQEGLDVDE